LIIYILLIINNYVIVYIEFIIIIIFINNFISQPIHHIIYF